MKIRKLLLFGVLSAVLLLVFAGCGKSAPGADAPDPVPAESLNETGTEVFEALIDELGALAGIDETAYVRTASTADALNRELSKGETDAIRLQTASADAITIPAGDYPATTVALNAENAGVTSDGQMGNLVVEALSEAGLTLNGRVKNLAVTGTDIMVTLNGGADRVYVQGKNCTLRLADGEYGPIVSVNATVVIENATASDVTVYMANGAPRTLKAGDTLSFREE